MSAVAEQNGLTRKISSEECDDLITKAFEAFASGDEELGYSYYAQVPLIPTLAKLAFELHGKEYCEANFNLSEANEKFGEGWMNG